LRNPRRKPAQKTLEFLEQLLYNRHCIDFNAIYECSRVGLIVSKAKIVAVAAYVMTQIAGVLKMRIGKRFNVITLQRINVLAY